MLVPFVEGNEEFSPVYGVFEGCRSTERGHLTKREEKKSRKLRLLSYTIQSLPQKTVAAVAALREERSARQTSQRHNYDTTHAIGIVTTLH